MIRALHNKLTPRARTPLRASQVSKVKKAGFRAVTGGQRTLELAVWWFVGVVVVVLFVVTNG